MDIHIMDDGSRLPWLIAIVLLFCAMYFAVTETAMASVSRVRIKTAAERGDARAKNALYLLDNTAPMTVSFRFRDQTMGIERCFAQHDRHDDRRVLRRRNAAEESGQKV